MTKPRETTWSDLKAGLAQFDRAGLGLRKDLHALRAENRVFLAARLGSASAVILSHNSKGRFRGGYIPTS